jgi:hypothetical protein
MYLADLLTGHQRNNSKGNLFIRSPLPRHLMKHCLCYMQSLLERADMLNSIILALFSKRA